MMRWRAGGKACPESLPQAGTVDTAKIWPRMKKSPPLIAPEANQENKIC
jgi:hypothetical protein